MNYQELKKKHRDEIDNFPIVFAFSDKQLKEGLKKLDATIEDVYSIGSGGIIRKTDSEKFKEMFKRHTKEHKEAMKDDDFFLDALVYELDNHEFSYTGDPSDAFDVLGVNADDPRTQEIFKQARKLVWREE